MGSVNRNWKSGAPGSQKRFADGPRKRFRKDKPLWRPPATRAPPIVNPTIPIKVEHPRPRVLPSTFPLLFQKSQELEEMLSRLTLPIACPPILVPRATIPRIGLRPAPVLTHFPLPWNTFPRQRGMIRSWQV